VFTGESAIPRRFHRPQRETGKRLRVNDQIRISPVRLIGDNDEQIGVIDLDEARRRAADAGLDLVEVAPNSTPPVCRVMDYGKWKYQQKKKEQKARSHSKQSELKEVRLRPSIDEHDLDIKMAKAREFLEEGDKVQFTMLFRGRQMVHRDMALQQMRDICAQLADLSKVEAEPRQMGRRMTMMLAPDKTGPKPAAKPEPAAKATPPAPAPAPAGSTSASG
jgi:translation initiation factor IF-3